MSREDNAASPAFSFQRERSMMTAAPGGYPAAPKGGCMIIARIGIVLIGLAAASPALAQQTPMHIEVENWTGGTVFVLIGQTNAELARGQKKTSDETNTAVGIRVQEGSATGALLCNGTARYQMIATATATFPTCTIDITSSRPDTQCIKSTQNSTAPTCSVSVSVLGP